MSLITTARHVALVVVGLLVMVATMAPIVVVSRAPRVAAMFHGRFYQMRQRVLMKSLLASFLVLMRYHKRVNELGTHRDELSKTIPGIAGSANPAQ